MRTVLGLASGLLALATLGLACSEDKPTTSGLCPEGQEVQGGQCVTPIEIRLNSLGFLPLRVKQASWLATTADAEFELRTVDDDEVVFSGTADGPETNLDTPEELYVATFSEFVEPGDYYISAGNERSVDFTIGDDAFDEALNVNMLALYGQRCGEEVEFEHGGSTYWHAACHQAEATLLDGESKRDDTGGWHDAGDYGKYVNNGAFAVSMLLAAFEHFPDFLKDREFEIPKRGGNTPDILDEARVELEWILKVQYDDGSFAHKVTAKGFEGVVMPENDSQPRYFVSASSYSTGQAVAVLAQAGRLYTDYDADFADSCLDAAKKGQTWLEENPEILQPEQSDFKTGGYSNSDDADERAWAAVELWETTGDAVYLDAFESLASDNELTVRASFDWPHTHTLAAATYLRSEREGRDPAITDSLHASALEQADLIKETAKSHGYGRGFTNYYWGSNGVTARLTFTAMLGFELSGNVEYVDTMARQVDHLLGRNTFNRSFVTGLGNNPPVNPHHRPSEADSVGWAWPGLLVGGPHKQGFDETYPDLEPAQIWVDEYDSYQHNEVAINWSTAMVYALAAVSATRDVDSVGCLPECSPDDVAAGGSGG